MSPLSMGAPAPPTHASSASAPTLGNGFPARAFPPGYRVDNFSPAGLPAMSQRSRAAPIPGTQSATGGLAATTDLEQTRRDTAGTTPAGLILATPPQREGPLAFGAVADDSFRGVLQRSMLGARGPGNGQAGDAPGAAASSGASGSPNFLPQGLTSPHGLPGPASAPPAPSYARPSMAQGSNRSGTGSASGGSAGAGGGASSAGGGGGSSSGGGRRRHGREDTEFSLNIDNVMQGADRRTTLMVRNIPNKYTQAAVLEEINEHFQGLYDFFYLPIDFKNKCNVGYAFINFIDFRSIVPFFCKFNGRRWNNFNSEKVCAITYARIQGKASMISRFQNSSLMEKDGEYRPLLFHSAGPDKGRAEPFPACSPKVKHHSGRGRGHSATED